MTEMTQSEMTAVDGGMYPIGPWTAVGGAFLVGYAIGTAIYEAW